MAKKEILSRLNLKDYNNELEVILEKKDFTSQVKNLLLSMFYKLEIGYKDYVLVKRDTQSKENFMESILYIIKEKCDQIELITPSREQRDNKRFHVYPDEKKISCYQNEASLLHAILEMGDKNFIILNEEEFIKEPIQKMLKEGYELDIEEALTNFDGWAWNNNLDKTYSLDYFLIYQNIRILMGNAFMYEWKRDRREKNDYFKEVKKKSSDFYNTIIRYCILKPAKEKTYRNYIENELKRLQEQLFRMENRNDFLKDMYEKKNSASERIKIMDHLLNDGELLKEEFLSRNAELPENEKIFSISDLEELIQNERSQWVNTLQECNSILDPKNYIKNVKKLEDSIEFIQNINFENIDNERLDQEQISLQEIFLEAIKKNLANATTKKEILELVYQFRYYLYLPINMGEKTVLIKEVDALKDQLEKIEKRIITKACKLNVLIIINQYISYNFEIIKKIIETKIINLEDVHVIFSKVEDKIHMEIYDGEVLDRTEDVNRKNEEDFKIKFGKKIKLFT